MEPPSSPGRTHYLPARRSSAAAVAAEVARAAGHPVVDALLRAHRAAVVVLDARRQIVAANVRFLALAGVSDPAALLGLRFGEALGCVGAPQDCATGRRCASCGAAFATLAGLRGDGGERECAIRVDRGGRAEDLSLRVLAVPFLVAGEGHVALVVSDLTAERCRAGAGLAPVAEAARAAAQLEAACGVLRRTPGAAALARVEDLTAQVRGELLTYLLLSGGGEGELPAPELREVPVPVALRRLAAALREHPAARGRVVEIDATHPEARVRAEPVALHHVLLALAVNAVEATRAGGTVRVTVEEAARETALRVWNAGAIPAAVAPRLFERHFSTRGAGRGHGLWATRLLAERVLGARVEHATSPAEGTWFWITLPRA